MRNFSDIFLFLKNRVFAVSLKVEHLFSFLIGKPTVL